MKTKIVAAVAVGILLLAGPASADIDFVLELNPFSFLHSPDVDEFIATDFVVMEEIDGSVSLYPSIKAGLGLGSERVIVDLLAAGGYVWNDAFMPKRSAPMSSYASKWIAGEFSPSDPISASCALIPNGIPGPISPSRTKPAGRPAWD